VIDGYVKSIALSLERIATCLELMVTAQAEQGEADDETNGCPKCGAAQELIAQFGGEEWECTNCRYRNQTQES
jgi:ribosomal protein S27AE